jgi:hypothetical protein
MYDDAGVRVDREPHAVSGCLRGIVPAPSFHVQSELVKEVQIREANCIGTLTKAHETEREARAETVCLTVGHPQARCCNLSEKNLCGAALCAACEEKADAEQRGGLNGYGQVQVR